MTEHFYPHSEDGSLPWILDGEKPVYRVLRLVWSAPAGSVPTTPTQPWYRPGTQPFSEADKQ